MMERIYGDDCLNSGWQYIGWLPVPEDLRNQEVDVSFRLSNLELSTPGLVNIDNLIFANVKTAQDSDGDGHLDEKELLEGVNPFFTPPVLVSKGCISGETVNCYDNITQGCEALPKIGTVLISDESFIEALSFSQEKKLILSGGWNADFTSQNSCTSLRGGLTILSGSLQIENLVIE